MAEVAIRASGLTKGFGEGETYTRAVSDVNFEAYLGEMLFVVGPLGIGQDDDALDDLGDFATGCGQRLDRGHRHLGDER